MMTIFARFFVVLAVLLSFPPTWAGSAAPEAPVEVTAAGSLEWNRGDRSYVAREQVVATQGDARLESNALTARYANDRAAGDLTVLEAEGQVVLSSGAAKAYGDRAVYTVSTGHAVLTGKDLRAARGADVLTARDRIEFFRAENRLSATGAVTVTHGGDRITADTLNAFFVAGPDGKMTARNITARGHVVIVTAAGQTVAGESGVYDVATGKAVLTGAPVDSGGKISDALKAGPAPGRVRGTFYPSHAKTTSAPAP